MLVAMISELGPEYLHFAIDTLRSALPAKGYMGHVLCYTLHAILAALMQVCHAALHMHTSCAYLLHNQPQQSAHDSVQSRLAMTRPAAQIHPLFGG